jgi:hypothetical protein
MLKNNIYRLVLLMIGITVIFIMTGCHATHPGYLYDQNYPYPYPAYYSPYYPYPYYYPRAFFRGDILIIHPNRDRPGESDDSGVHGRILESEPSGSSGRNLSPGSSTGQRGLEK